MSDTPFSDPPPDMEPGTSQMEHLAEDVGLDEDELRDEVGDDATPDDDAVRGRPDETPTFRAGAD